MRNLIGILGTGKLIEFCFFFKIVRSVGRKTSKFFLQEWNLTGKVQQGKMLGRTLGFPTANLVLPDYTRLTNGIYAVRVRRENGSLHDGVASFGRRPTFDNGAELFETFLFDFDDDLYGENIIVSLFGFLREEGKFASAEALVEQMKKDESEARALLVGVQPLSTLDGVLNFTA